MFLVFWPVSIRLVSDFHKLLFHLWSILFYYGNIESYKCPYIDEMSCDPYFLHTSSCTDPKCTFYRFSECKTRRNYRAEVKDCLVISRLNPGIKNRHNFFLSAIFLFQKLWTDWVNHADSGDIKILTQFPGKSILKRGNIPRISIFKKPVENPYLGGFRGEE